MSRAAVRVYRLLLRAAPPAHRRGFGAAMEATFEERLRERSHGGRPPLAWLLREYAGVLFHGLGERLARPSPRAAFSPVRERTMRLLQELRHALRRLIRTPAFTLATFLTFALALGATLAVGAVVKSVILDPLPYPESHRLVAFDHSGAGLGLERGLGMTEALYVEYGRLPQVDALAVYQLQQGTLTGRGEPARVPVAAVTPDLVDVLRVEPRLGRWFAADEAEPGAPFVVVLSHAAWRDRFGADPAILGRTITLYGDAAEIVGVMPPGFAFPGPEVELWRPLQIDRAAPRLGGFNYVGVARLTAGASVDDLRTAMDAAIAGLPERYPDQDARVFVEELRLAGLPLLLQDQVVGTSPATLWVLAGAAGLLLALACANLTNLFLVRWEGRQREVAVRRALGAGRSSVAAHFLAESLAVTLTAGAAAVALGWAAVGLLRSVAPPGLPRLHEVALDPAVAVAALAVAAVAGLLFGGTPALRPAGSLAAPLREAGRGGTQGRLRMRTRNALMALQVAVAVVLLAGSALMVRSYRSLAAVDAGFEADGVLTFRIGLPANRYGSAEAAATFVETLRERLAALPGVTAAGGVTCPPLAGMCFGDPMGVEGQRWAGEGPIPPIVSFRRVTPGYFEAMGIDLHAGRVLEPADHRTRTGAAVASEALVRLYLADRDPLGARVHPEAGGEPFTWYELAGVVEDVPTFGLTEAAPTPALYLPLLHAEDDDPGPQGMFFAVRATVPPLTLAPAVRRLVRELDAEVPVAELRTLREIRSRASVTTAFTTFLLLVAAGTALLLGVVGIYGVVAHVVGRRAQEMGIRMALGAAPTAVTGLVLRQGGRVVLLGTAVGLVAALQLTAFLEGLLYGVEARDPATLAATLLLVLAVGFLAVWVPARRAAGGDPLDALRAE